MKQEIKYKDKVVTMKCVEMSHSSMGGEYEIALPKKIELNLDNICKTLGGSGYELIEMNDRALSVTYNTAVITILKKGRILIQDLLPDEYDEAIKIGEKLIKADHDSKN